MERPPRPGPQTCPQCGSVTDAWEWNAEDDEWDWEDEWWRDPQYPNSEEPGRADFGNYTCSRWCHVKRERAKADSTP